MSLQQSSFPLKTRDWPRQSSQNNGTICLKLQSHPQASCFKPTPSQRVEWPAPHHSTGHRSWLGINFFKDKFYFEMAGFLWCKETRDGTLGNADNSESLRLKSSHIAKSFVV